MKHVITIAKRELSAYFTSPIGYIFMMVFVTISVGLFITPFFSFPVADMRTYFSSLPLMLCIFIPAITMRSWAQERSENTWEMLLTFPMKAWQLTLGKFVASIVFLSLALAATATIPVMLKVLGEPDMGVIASSYLGTLLLGGYFMSMGIFFSGFFKDQILSFIITLLACFTMFMLGTHFCATYIDGVAPGLGTTLSEILGFTGHFTPFTRGVIELADVIFFCAWTIIFLLLNILYIDGRSRPKSRMIFSTALCCAVAIGLMGNWLVSDISLKRIDITEDKIFTVSQGSKNILSELDTPVQIKLYISPKKDMPTGMTTIEQDLRDKLQELRVAANGNIEFSVINLQVSEVIALQEDPEESDDNEDEKSEEDIIEKRLLDKGIQPYTVQAMSSDQITNKLIYCSLGIAYKDKEEEIIPQIQPQDLDTLEYSIVSTISKIARETKPKIALVAPVDRVDIPFQLRQFYAQTGQAVPDTEDPYDGLQEFLNHEGYEVERIELNEASPLPELYDTLIVLNPRTLNDRQRWEINHALVSGKSVILAVQHYKWDYIQSQGKMRMNIQEEKPGINSLLEAYGLHVDTDLLMDVNNVSLNMQLGNNPLTGMRSIDSPTHILVNNTSMDQKISITSRLSTIFYLWGTALVLDEEKLSELGLENHTLVSTSEQAWKSPMGEGLSTSIFNNPNTNDGPFPLITLVKGQFPDAYEGQEAPPWSESSTPIPEEDEEETPEAMNTKAPGQLILMGCSQLFRRDFMQAANLDLFINSIDAITLGDDLVNVRSRKPLDRVIDLPSTRTRSIWKMVNYGLANGIIALIGIVGAILRRRSRNAYTLSHMNAQKD